MTTQRVLLVVTPSIEMDRLVEEVPPESLRDAELHVVVPAVAKSAISYWFTDDEAIDKAREVAAEAEVVLGSRVSSIESAAGDSDPELAVRDALAGFNPDRIIVVHGDDHPGYRESKLDDLDERIHRNVEDHLLAAA